MARKSDLVNVSVQGQVLTQQQRLTLRQVRFMRMLEMPLQQLEQAVMNEIDDNPALYPTPSEHSSQNSEYEPGGTLPADGADYQSGVDYQSGADDEEDDALQPDDVQSGNIQPDDGYEYAKEERRQVLDEALRNIGGDDRMENEFRNRMEQNLTGDATLYELLTEQIALLDISQSQKELMDYILGALDDDGLLRKDVDILVEELAVFQEVSTTREEIQHLVGLLKTLDPAGIGAQSLQECLLIQVDRRKKSAVTAVMKRILRDYFDEFIHDHWSVIYNEIDENVELVDDAFGEIRKLNPRPGAGLADSVNETAQQIVPDFFVETHEEGDITFTVNTGKIPRLALAEDFEDLLKRYEGVDREKLRKQEFEAMNYAKSKVMRAHAYIVMLQLRYRTMALIMKKIIGRQREFFLTGDDSDLKPLLMKDLASELGYDVSTISRACNHKYVQTEWGIYPMKHFFAVSYASEQDGEEYTLRQILDAMRELVDSEDKRKPLSDAKLTALLNEKGFNVARRTVAKHRERMGIKVARMRKV